MADIGMTLINTDSTTSASNLHSISDSDSGKRIMNKEKDLPPASWVRNLSMSTSIYPDNWPPNRFEKEYDFINWSTHEAYYDPCNEGFTPLFANARGRLDYSYHRKPAQSRQALQDAILQNIVEATTKNGASSSSSRLDNNDRQHQNNSRPWIVFTAGAMGVGKGYTLAELNKCNLFPLHSFLRIDPDMIKAELPEMSGYFSIDPESAATKVHRESTQIADILLEYALMNNIDTIVDGSLRDVDYYRTLFERIRRERSNYRIAILHITATDEVIHARAEKRGRQTGRMVPIDVLDESIRQVPASVRALSPYADVTFEVSNDDGLPLKLNKRVENKNSTTITKNKRLSWELDFAFYFYFDEDEEWDSDEECDSSDEDEVPTLATHKLITGRIIEEEEKKQEMEHDRINVKDDINEGDSDNDKNSNNDQSNNGNKDRYNIQKRYSESMLLRQKSKRLSTMMPQKRKTYNPTICRIGKMRSCFKSQRAMNDIYKKSYPHFCPRCHLADDVQCGVCVHGVHRCQTCEKCEQQKRKPIPRCRAKRFVEKVVESFN